jgi:hypothetical protein
MSIIFHTFFTEKVSEKLGMFSPLFHFQGENFERSQKVLQKL